MNRIGIVWYGSLVFLLFGVTCNEAFSITGQNVRNAFSVLPSLQHQQRQQRQTQQQKHGQGVQNPTFFTRNLISSSSTTTTTTAMSMVVQGQEHDDKEVYDLAVIGAGAVGTQAAMVAAGAPYHRRVCLIDAPMASGQLMDPNGEDLSIGAPTGLFSKALRDTSKRIKVTTLRGMGLREDSVWNEIISNCIDLASANAFDVRKKLVKLGIVFVEGFASFPDGRAGDDVSSLFVTRADSSITTVKAKNILLASGSKPFRPGGIPFDGKRIFDSDSINQLKFLPKSIAITGSGIIAFEYARIFRNLGADVTLIIRDRIPRNGLMKIGMDPDVASQLVTDLIKSGIHIERGAQVARFLFPKNEAPGERKPVRLVLEPKSGEKRRGRKVTAKELLVDAYLAAVGRKPNTDSLNLRSAGVEIDDYGGIKVDATLATTCPNIYAAGDVVGRPFLASTGVAQGLAAVEAMFGELSADATRNLMCDPEEDDLCITQDSISIGAKFDPNALAANPFAFPTGIWSSPEAAAFGLTAEQAQGLGLVVQESEARYSDCLRGRVFSPTGLLKLVFETPSGRIVGVHICGDDACELIHYGMELVRAKRTIYDLVENVFSAVTYHEMYKLAASTAVDDENARKKAAEEKAAKEAVPETAASKSA